MRLVFAGSPSAAVPSLHALVESEHDVVAVLTRDDTPQGRKRVLTPTPVASAAEELGLPVIRSRRITDDVTERIRALDADLGVIVAYGALLREPLLSTPRLGWINLHFSLLPRWRGAAPVQRALMAGDRETGAAVFQLVPELDAGVVYGSLPRELGGDETAGDLLRELARSGSLLLTAVVDQLADGSAVGVPQEGEVTLAPKLTLDDARLDFARDAAAVHDRYRGVTPEPGAFAEYGGLRVKVLELRTADAGTERPAPGRVEVLGRRVFVGTSSDALELVTVQPSGKKPMPAGDWIRGLPDGSRPSFDLSTPEVDTTAADTTGGTR
ncbi:Methionyl-tRNA formyltransferase [Frondihabitans sp. 762G35]|uniref:methionyl-tRNA formyltransferase n=1 Tax=Frondihabitans sp. 762G35 TaxID=1446794 RepID=UPI000D203C25|nr:methionyl-tRNA formyltransferase [Frondihabitans sp. 762G35]ARC56910.1 Methionyl-tRNA formyltransferase [Frondihabitans sp. 762G35]